MHAPQKNNQTQAELVFLAKLTDRKTTWKREESEEVLTLLVGWGGGVKAKTTKSVDVQHIFVLKGMSQKQKVGGGKSIHFMEALFKTSSSINVWWLLLSG